MKKSVLLLLICFPMVMFAQWTSSSKPANAIVTAPKLQRDAKFSIDNSGNSFYVWTDDRNNKTELYAQKLDILGAPQWTASGTQIGDLTNGFTRDIRFSPKIIRPDGKGGGTCCVVLFSKLRQSAFSTTLYSVHHIRWQIHVARRKTNFGSNVFLAR